MLRLRELREQRRLTQEGLAREISVSQSTISAYEKGERTPDLAALISLARFFNVSIDYLVGLSETKRHITGSDLTAAEMEHLSNYRRLSKDRRERVCAYMDGLSER